jgi:hypothetical protein
MNDFFIQADANMAGKFFVSQKGAANPGSGHQLGSGMVDFAGGHPRSDAAGQFVKDLGSDFASLAHFFNLMGTLDADHADSLLVVKEELGMIRQMEAITRQNEGRVLASLPDLGGQNKAARVFKTPEARYSCVAI